MTVEKSLRFLVVWDAHCGDSAPSTGAPGASVNQRDWAFVCQGYGVLECKLPHITMLSGRGDSAKCWIASITTYASRLVSNKINSLCLATDCARLDKSNQSTGWFTTGTERVMVLVDCSWQRWWQTCISHVTPCVVPHTYLFRRRLKATETNSQKIRI